MSGLDGIKVKVVPADPAPAAADGLSGNGLALLHEIAGALQALLDGGGTGVIDLRGVPMTPADYAWLQAALGQGEVEASIEAAGTSTVRETAYPGVWWVTHRNGGGDIAAELIEITHLPEILRTIHSFDPCIACAVHLTDPDGEELIQVKVR
ncbi:MAG: hydrogenase expression/formation C-terminal domain-containing protein [Pseudomonadota bacterium]|uniref:hydrogenase expression/formation C-terminal domain-containing protein n=1 Tax=Thermithiobacillus tepidarius TaxID=929 RepID=UPI0003F9298F|nr:hydrogenase expression/formation C-terminal domain-containing protein [Thermithiobacillus tepidarius]